MIIPQYWAEGRAQYRTKGRQITARRFGWSDASEAEAQANADARADEALKRLIAGEKLPRREFKVPYNGAQGLPIREEIVARHGGTIITRNSYGARCLNTPNVFFADIDFKEDEASIKLWLVGVPLLAICATAIGWSTHSKPLGFALFFFGLKPLSLLIGKLYHAILRSKGGEEQIAIRRVHDFLARHPDWNVRLYRTPAGLRVLATHCTFEPNDPAVAECFAAIKADPVYVLMCKNQQCFRARVSAKPWRVGIATHLSPRPGVWPIAPERLTERRNWILGYEAAAESFAACSLMEEIGSKLVDPDVVPVLELHDNLCKAKSGLPLA